VLRASGGDRHPGRRAGSGDRKYRGGGAGTRPVAPLPPGFRPPPQPCLPRPRQPNRRRAAIHCDQARRLPPTNPDFNIGIVWAAACPPFPGWLVPSEGRQGRAERAEENPLRPVPRLPGSRPGGTCSAPFAAKPAPRHFGTRRDPRSTDTTCRWQSRTLIEFSPHLRMCQKSQKKRWPPGMHCGRHSPRVEWAGGRLRGNRGAVKFLDASRQRQRQSNWAVHELRPRSLLPPFA
jgi:hypothetical protein